jgi:hypothetical protein
MPYQITEEPHFVRLVFTGDITPPDLVALDADVAALWRNRPVALHSLADFSQVVDHTITYADMLAYAEQRRTQRFANPIKSAIVASAPSRSASRVCTRPSTRIRRLRSRSSPPWQRPRRG